MEAERPLQIVGAVNAYAAMLAERAGFRALYLSGAGVANYSLGLPDLGITHPGDVLVDAVRITAASDLPLLVDIDTGWGHALRSTALSASWSGRARRASRSRTRSSPSAAATVPARRSSKRRRWSIAFAPL